MAAREGILDDFHESLLVTYSHCIREKQRVMKLPIAGQATKSQGSVYHQASVGWQLACLLVAYSNGTPFDLVSKVGFPTQLIH